MSEFGAQVESINTVPAIVKALIAKKPIVDLVVWKKGKKQIWVPPSGNKK